MTKIIYLLSISFVVIVASAILCLTQTNAVAPAIIDMGKSC